LFLLLTLGVNSALSLDNALGDTRKIISFYNPEANNSSFTSLKISYDTYLSKYTDFRLQPFKDRNTFEYFNSEKLNPVLLISSWHYQHLATELKSRIRPALIATYKGEITSQKILATKKSLHSLAELQGAVIASSADSTHTREMLDKLLGKHPPELLASIKILTVPKEIDALMSVAYGVVDAAITYESTLQKLSTFNPNQSAILHVLVRSDEILLPILFIPKTDSFVESGLVRIFEDMPKTQEGRQRLRMIGFDGWKNVDADILQKLDSTQ
jgi:hypothetical protein